MAPSNWQVKPARTGSFCFSWVRGSQQCGALACGAFHTYPDITPNPPPRPRASRGVHHESEPGVSGA